MTIETQPVPTLDEALRAFRSTRATYPSSSDRAVADVILALAGEVHALRRAMVQAQAQPVVAEAAAFDAIHQQLQALVAANQSQQQEIQTLRAQLAPMTLRRRRSILDEPTPVVPLKVIRPIEYWANHIPEYGDSITPAELAAALARPRVRPEDITLTPEDIARQRSRRPQRQRAQLDRSTILLILMILAVAAGAMILIWNVLMLFMSF